MAASKNWLLKWLDDQGIRTIEQAQKALSEAGALDSLEAEAAATALTLDSPVDAGSVVVAGSGIDFSQRLDCPTYGCRKHQVDTLFNHVWHYFDRVVVHDRLAGILRERSEYTDRKVWDAALNQIQIMLYLKEIGADSLTEFRQKPAVCVAHWKKHAKEAGLGKLLASIDELRGSLEANSEVSVRKGGSGTFKVTLNIPEFSVGSIIYLKRAYAERLTQKQIERLIMDDGIREHLAHLTSDLLASKTYGASLGAVIPFHQQLLRKALPPTLEDVAFMIELPVLQGVSAKSLIAFRRNEQEAFIRFQSALRTAIQERLKVTGSFSAKVVADQIQTDLIQPRLNEIRALLASSERTLTKKSAASVFLGGLATTCGVLCGAPVAIAVAAGVAASVGGVGAAAASHIDTQTEIQSKDMYFMWKALEHLSHGG